MMKHSVLAYALLAGAVLTAGPAVAEPDVNGVWMRDDGNARVRIAPCGDDLCATNLWIKDTSGGEAVGDRLVMDVKPEGDKLAGTAFDAKRNRSYSIAITAQGATMSTRGCILGGVLCKSVGWTRSAQ